MNAVSPPHPRQVRRLILFALALLLTGCATHKIDWASRVGNYTFDQAVLEIGPPDKQARLQDGRVVADWLTGRGYSRAYPAYAYAGYPYRFGGPFDSSYIETSPDYFLRLTFGPDGKLKSWKKFAR